MRVPARRRWCGRSGAKALCIAVMVLWQGGCVFSLPRTVVTTAASDDSAEVIVNGERYGLSDCQSGDLEYFLGADLYDPEGDVRVRLVMDPVAGPHVRLAGVPTLGEVLLSADRCSRLEAEVGPTGWRVNDVRDVSGFVEAECEAESGEQIAIHAHFEHCH